MHPLVNAFVHKGEYTPKSACRQRFARGLMKPAQGKGVRLWQEIPPALANGWQERRAHPGTRGAEGEEKRMGIRVMGDAPHIAFGLGKAAVALADTALTVANLADARGAARYAGAPLAPQAYALRREADGWLLAGDAAGCMYGLLDIAHAARAGLPWPEGVHTPAIAERGIKLNIPLDARTPSYSDASDSAWHNIPHMWEMDFWHTLLDELAMCKYTAVSLWSLHPFPSLVRVPGYERVALADVMRTSAPVTGATTMGTGMYGKRFAEDLHVVRRMTMDEKIAFWRAVMQYGADRGIDFYIVTWNVFVYGTEHSGYGIDCELDNPVTQDYFAKSVEALVRTYPLLRGVGVTAGERMTVGWAPSPDVTRDVRWLADTYGRGIQNAIAGTGRRFRLIHRQHMSGAREILDAYSGVDFEVDFSFKYSQAHMYADTRPHFGDAFFASLPAGRKTWLTVRNDDLYMHRWGGVAFAREYVQHMPHGVLRGFLMGPDGYTWGRDYLTRTQEDGLPRRAVLERQGYMLAIWGHLAYEHTLPDAWFHGLLAERLGCASDTAARVFALCETVSLVVPLMNRMHWHDFDFQHYPEANCSVSTANHIAHMGGEVTFHDVHDYIMTPAQPGTAYLGVRECCMREKYGPAILPDMIAPDAVATDLRARAQAAEQQLAAFPQACGELAALLADCRGLALLARFYAAKVEAALATQRAVLGAGPAQAARAMACADEAFACWRRYAAHAASLYVPQRLTRMNGRLVDLEALIPQAELDRQMVHHLMQEYA